MTKKRNTPLIERIGPEVRLGVSLGVALLAFALALLLAPAPDSWHSHLVGSWDAGALAYLVLAWVRLWTSDAKSTRDHALAQDLSGHVIFLLVVVASCASVVALGFVVGPIRGLPASRLPLDLALTFAALISSWLLIHTVFAFHYAHRYYAGPHGECAAVTPLNFPGGCEPDYSDFAYYSFVVGMTSQVSDVAVISNSMRRLTLLHGILAFLFNVAVLALAINIFASVI